MIVERNEKVWQIGNTGFRNAERLIAFFRLLEEQTTPLWMPGLPPLKAMPKAKDFLVDLIIRARDEDPYGSRSLMRIDPKLQSKDGVGKALATSIELGLLKGPEEGGGLAGLDVFTPLGQRFCKARTRRIQKAIFAQALAQLQVRVRGGVGYPLQRIAQVFEELEYLAPGQNPYLNRHELAWCVLSASLDGPARPIAQSVLRYRKKAAFLVSKRESREARLQRENQALVKLGVDLKNLSRDSLMSYANVTMLYLLFTGLFDKDSSTNIIAPDPMQKEIWEALAKGNRNPWNTPAVRDPVIARLEQHLGEPLAGKTNALFVGLELLDRRAQNHQMCVPAADSRIDALLAQSSEIEWEPNKPFSVKALKAAPAALEWAATAWVCRALARSGVSPTGRGWRGRVDVDGRPERTASGGGADAVLETPTHRFVVEATLLTNSLQDGREGESVRRHVAASGPPTNKEVWGVFAAPELDNNTLMSFSLGGHYNGDTWHQARVIPFTFDQMRALHSAQVDAPSLIDLFERIWQARPQTWPVEQHILGWRQTIEKIVQETVRQLRARVISPVGSHTICSDRGSDTLVHAHRLTCL